MLSEFDIDWPKFVVKTKRVCSRFSTGRFINAVLAKEGQTARSFRVEFSPKSKIISPK